MSRIAFFCIPAQGHTNPTLPLVRELTRRGHEVRYWSYEPFREKIEKTGAEFIPCDACDEEWKLTREEAARLGSDIALSIRVLVDTTLSLDTLVTGQMRTWQPDGIVFDSMAPWGKAAAKKLGIPAICSNTTFAFNRHSAKVMKQELGDLLKMLLAMPKMNQDIARLQKAGYPIKNVLDLIGADESTPTLVYTSSHFQPAAGTFGENFFFAGPLLRQPEGEHPGKVQVYVSMGTVNNDMLPLYQNCIRALEGKTAILSVGEAVDPKRLSAPENIRIFPRVDQIAVLEKADVFLTHCGMNSVSEALYHGVPLVMDPKTKEQQGVAARVLELGAGILLQKEDPRTIRAAVDAALHDPQYRAAAQAIAQSFRDAPGATGAADFIEAQL